MSELLFDEFDGGGVIGLGQEVELVEGDDLGFGGELGGVAGEFAADGVVVVGGV